MSWESGESKEYRRGEYCTHTKASTEATPHSSAGDLPVEEISSAQERISQKKQKGESQKFTFLFSPIQVEKSIINGELVRVPWVVGVLTE